MSASHYLTRHEEGQREFSRLLKYWLKSSDLTLRQFCCICHWAAGEPNWITSGPLSRLINGEVQKIPLVKLDLFSVTNHAIWTWKVEGSLKATEIFGPLEQWMVKSEYLEGAIWLPGCRDEESPLQLGGFSEIVCRKLSLPYLPEESDPSEDGNMSEALSILLNELVLNLGLSPREGLDALIDALPPSDSYSQDEVSKDFVRKILMGANFSASVVERELPRLAPMVESLRGLPKGSYGPPNLRGELL